MITIALVLPPAMAFSHGGGLNADGCHRETATGGYHCHSGGGVSGTTTALISVGIALVLLGGWYLWKRFFQADEIALRDHPESRVAVDLVKSGVVLEF